MSEPTCDHGVPGEGDCKWCAAAEEIAGLTTPLGVAKSAALVLTSIASSLERIADVLESGCVSVDADVRGWVDTTERERSQ